MSVFGQLAAIHLMLKVCNYIKNNSMHEMLLHGRPKKENSEHVFLRNNYSLSLSVVIKEIPHVYISENRAWT